MAEIHDLTPGIDTAIDYTVNIVTNYVRSNAVPAAALPGLIASVHAAIVGLDRPAAAEIEPVEQPTAAQIRKSVTPDALISFIDGRPFKTLKRHLRGHGLTPDSYRARFGLGPDYPMTAPAYSAQRSALAKSLGLGVPGGPASLATVA
ncbi:MucR family transcriptional regulator [Methylobacterium longum]|uniref:MucR family transcriptional regulator n=1 Tax=Methylobacterium longum TaxID=767694 RepID=A0ABT8AYL1_9HYPH|nr:MucR family transcriptional regulator [Methylobacterium longum]MDN3574645.1 MucR family transcriptional regulator [Methylobacterium longum]GJE13667.1 Transcriptional regulatory protein ros [Methylobacterium longum]